MTARHPPRLLVPDVSAVNAITPYLRPTRGWLTDRIKPRRQAWNQLRRILTRN